MVGAAENPDYERIWNPRCCNSLECMRFILPVRRETVIPFLLFQPTAQKITLNFFSLGPKSNIYFKPVQKIRRLKKNVKGTMLNMFNLQFILKKPQRLKNGIYSRLMC